MSGGKQQQKNRRDAVKNWCFHVLPPERSRAQFTTSVSVAGADCRCEARMDNWARLHPPGSLQVIHYNPENPVQVSRAGADEQFRTNSAAISLRASNQILPLGAVLLLAALLTRYFTLRSGQSTSAE